MMLLQNQHKGNYTGPGAPFTYFTDGPGRKGGRAGGFEGFFGSEILAKRDFFGSMKDAGNFWGIALFISSNQQ